MKLTNESELLISYFTKNKCVNASDPNKHTTEIIRKLYLHIYHAYISVQKLKHEEGNRFYKPKAKTIKTVSQITKPSSFDFHSFPEPIQAQINELMSSELEYSFSLLGRKIKLCFVLEEAKSQVDIEKYNRYVDSILMWLFMLDKFGTESCASSSLTLYFYFTSLRKKLPKSNIDVLDTIHVNTAFTRTCQKDAEIVIFREEEWFKVLLHETFHTFALDFSGMDMTKCNTSILSIFEVESEVNLFESYTEFWAEILNALFCSFHSLHDKKDLTTFLTHCNFFINVERTYSFFQLVKTLDFMNLTYKNLYSKQKKDTFLRTSSYKEKTNVLSYYVIKTILMNDYQLFLSWCSVNNESILQFKKTEANLEAYCDFISKKHKSVSMIANIHHTEKCYNNFINHYSIHKNSINYLLTNMRMSICELG
jgi:hypothetical protein